MPSANGSKEGSVGLEHGFAHFLCKGADGFEGHRVSVATTQLCPYIKKADIDNTKTNVCGRVPIKLYGHWNMIFR